MLILTNIGENLSASLYISNAKSEVMKLEYDLDTSVNLVEIKEPLERKSKIDMTNQRVLPEFYSHVKVEEPAESQVNIQIGNEEDPDHEEMIFNEPEEEKRDEDVFENRFYDGLKDKDLELF